MQMRFHYILFSLLLTASLASPIHAAEVLINEIHAADKNIRDGRSWSVETVLQARSLSILRKILTCEPLALIHKGECNPLVVLIKYRWPVGAQRLLEAGAKVNGPIPAEHTDILTLSLEQTCLKVVRSVLFLPLTESVKKLPLPPPAKSKFLYR